MDRYQDIAEPQFAEFDNATARRWLTEMDDRIPDAERITVESVEAWRRKAREALARETALRMTWEDYKEIVPIRVIPGIPRHLVDILDEIDPDLLFLVLNRRQIRAAASGLRFAETHSAKLDRLAPEYVQPISWVEIATLRERFSKIGDWLDSVRIPKPEVIVNRDILGAYWYRKPEITIHWQTIGISSMILGLPVADITATVLFHELAHAWHHRGFDIDGRQWDTDSFARSNLYVVEGVAQFYAALLTATFSRQHPQLKATWDAMEALDRGPYLAHLPWTKLPRGREVIRAAMLDTRLQSGRGVTFPEFEASIENALGRIGEGTQV